MSKVKNIQHHISGYLTRHNEIVSVVNFDEIEAFINLILDVQSNDGTLYFAGNGGSAATASHFVNDMLVGAKLQNKTFKAISLCDNQAVITCISNDFGYEDVFLRQINGVIKQNDVLICISASGNSVNLVKAVEYARSNNVATVGITAFDGGKIKEISDYSVHIPTAIGEYGHAEDLHMLLDHLITSYLMTLE